MLVSLGVLLACALAWWGGDAALNLSQWRAFDDAVRAADAAGESGPVRTATWSFVFHERPVTVTVPYRVAELEAARAIETRRVFHSSGWLRERYVRELALTQSAGVFIGEMAEEFDRHADALGLTDPDDRLEFFAAAVQAIPYGDVNAEIRLPIEVVAYGAGVCTEKSILLGELLLRDGYDTVLWVFPSQRHVALGVASTGEGFRGSGYAFIETTRPAWVGEAGPGYRANGPRTKSPFMIRLGGTQRYESGAMVEYVLRVLEDAERDSDRFRSYDAYARAFTGPRHGEYAQIAEELEYAPALAAWIEANPHHRDEVYALLTGEGPRT